ncbi:MAG: DNA-processing protein DprA [Bacilli bacterium]
MIKKEYLITLLNLYYYRISRVWHEINENDFGQFSGQDFSRYLRTLIKDKRKDLPFDELEINKAVRFTISVVQYCEENQINIITFEDQKYPKNKLNLIPQMERPIVLYAKGNISLLCKQGVAIIGSRETDEAYFKIGIELGKELSNNYVINSGLALGSDTAGHEGALLGTGQTVAILANGLNTIYPATNKKLASEILAKEGLLLSEYPPYSKIQPYFFTERDRLQAALSLATIVIETGIKSGTMITVKFTERYGKNLLVVKPLNNGFNYNDKGNSELLKKQHVYEILYPFKFPEIENFINSKKEIIKSDEKLFSKQSTKKVIKQFVWKIEHNLFGDITYRRGLTNAVEEIPSDYKIISRSDEEIITEKEVDETIND